MSDVRIWCLTLGSLVFLPGFLAAQPTFELTWSCPECPDEPFVGHPHDTKHWDVAALLKTGGLGEGETGARGWTLSAAVEGCSFWGVTTDSYGSLPPTAAAGAGEVGFEQTRVTWEAEPGSACEGFGGFTSAVILSLSEPPITLEPSESHSLVNLRLGTEVPAVGECEPCRIFYADGCSKDGEPLTNTILYAEDEIVPETSELTVDVCAVENCADAPLNVMVQAAAMPESSLPFAGMLTSSVEDRAQIDTHTPPGMLATASFAAAIVSQETSGVQGWSFSISVEGDFEPLSATVEGTASEVALDGGFHRTEIVDPDRPCATGEPQGEGFVSAVVLNFMEPVTLLPVGTASVLRLRLQSKRPQGEQPLESLVNWIDGLAGAG